MTREYNCEKQTQGEIQGNRIKIHLGRRSRLDNRLYLSAHAYRTSDHLTSMRWIHAVMLYFHQAISVLLVCLRVSFPRMCRVRYGLMLRLSTLHLL